MVSTVTSEVTVLGAVVVPIELVISCVVKLDGVPIELKVLDSEGIVTSYVLVVDVVVEPTVLVVSGVVKLESVFIELKTLDSDDIVTSEVLVVDVWKDGKDDNGVDEIVVKGVTVVEFL